ncbi:unnamed protein product [Heligmosomoides polygyrus]|uniref:SCP domain-containing protein n=1 Tax=Heligmosomoides polygyrus TaxID=6339 RepID=A0A183FJX7_HELPZ|nr:unnamed protein product [Heligmosomoides polygyrus]
MFIVDLAALLAVVTIIPECQSDGYSKLNYEVLLAYKCNGTEISDDERDSIVQAINDLRRRRYDCDLEELAKQKVSDCPMFRFPDPPSSHGMNIVAYIGTLNPLRSAFNGWHEQGEYVQIPITPDMIRTSKDFLNMVVGTSNGFGCYQSVCPDSDPASMFACVFQAPHRTTIDNDNNNHYYHYSEADNNHYYHYSEADNNYHY